ncbi:29230_t:CDS:1, partial [Gigaspora margarita]
KFPDIVKTLPTETGGLGDTVTLIEWMGSEPSIKSALVELNWACRKGGVKHCEKRNKS